jgi:hypothetical protein
MWHKVVISAGTGIEQVQGASLMSDKGGYEPAWRTAGLPMDAEVYSGKDANGDYIFYFNPLATKIGKEVLAKFDAVECEKPEIEGLKFLR